MASKAYSALQTIITMKRFGFSSYQLRNAFVTYVRPHLEYACIVWGPTVRNSPSLSEMLENVQKRTVKVILDRDYINYEKGRRTIDLPSLSERRDKLIMNFGIFLLNNKHHRFINLNFATNVSHSKACRFFRAVFFFYQNV